MFFDVLIIVIVAVCAVFGFRAGFLISLTRVFGWIGALAVAFFYHKRVEAWVLEHTAFFERLGARIHAICSSFVDMYLSGVSSSLPSGISSAVGGKADAFVSDAAAKITDHAFTIFVFVGIILGIKIVLLVLTLLLSKKFHGGFLGFIDGFVGMLLGLFSSVVAVLVAFTLIVPLSYSLNANAYFFIQEQMGESVVAQIIYDNNPILDVMDGFIPAELNPERWLDNDAFTVPAP